MLAERWLVSDCYAGRASTCSILARSRQTAGVTIRHACELDPAEKLQQALDVMRAGIRLKRSTLRRQFAEADETEVDHRLAEWLRGDG